MTPDLLFRIFADKRLRAIVLLVVLAALAHQVSLLLWQFFPAPEQADASPSGIPVAAVDAAPATTNFRQQAEAVGRAFLFGKAETKAQVVKVEQAPQTQLNYKLRGIYFSPEPRLSSAIVEVKPNQSKLYRLEDELADNISLANIEMDHILINRYGKLERLNLQKPKPPGSRDLIASRGSGESAGQNALLSSYKKRYLKNPMALATRFQAIPVQQDGRNIGFKLKPLRGETLLRRLNFQPNDIFTAVNGVSLNNPFEALDALKSLTTANSVTVTFLRNGAEQTLDFQI